MKKPTKGPSTSASKKVNSNYRGWQSDVIVDLVKQYDFPYIALNPGASFRGLHDSLINYGNNEPQMMLCNHEEIAVQIAHGYAKATGKPMIAIVHNLVGLLHCNLAIYYAFIDRVPIFIMGATGPMDEAKRRPHIDWTHTALVQGNAVRDYTKWDYQPTSVHGVPESFARAYSIMMTEPKGPIYMCYDAALQESPLTEEVTMPPLSAVRTPSPMMPAPEALQAIADKLLKAENPLLMAEYVGRREGGFESMVELAETVGAPVWDIRQVRAENDILVRDRPLGAALATALGSCTCVLMRGHGMTVVGESVCEAVFRAYYTEMNARLQLQAEGLEGPIQFLSEAEGKGATAANRGTHERPWELWKREALGGK